MLDDFDVYDVAELLGLQIGPTGHDIPCPVCKQETRHTRSGDTRGAIWISPSNPCVWMCIQCELRGDAKDLWAYATYGIPYKLTTYDQRVSAELPTNPKIRLRKLATVMPKYPSPEKLSELFGNITAVLDSPETMAYLETRFGGKVDTSGLRNIPVSVLANSTSLTTDWVESGYVLLFPLYSHQSAGVKSFIGRNIKLPPPRIKSKSPTGYSRSGLRLELRRSNSRSVIVTEGEMDWLAACLIYPNSSIIGIISGSICPGFLDSYNGQDIEILTDYDAAGELYAEKIQKLYPRASRPAVRLS